MSLLRTQDLLVNIAGHRVCRDLNLRIDAGECWGLLGRNGAGKTTLLLTLAGLRPPEGGRVFLQDSALEALSRRQVARRLGMMFQDSEDPFPATVLETALIGRHPHLGRWGWESAAERRIAREALGKTGLEDFEQRSVASLSGGERRRLAMATLLTQEPLLALLDEPVNHLDLHQQVLILELCKEFCGDTRGILMALHDINLATRFCSHLLLLFPDGTHRLGPRDEITEMPLLERLYGHPLGMVEDPEGRRLFVPL